MIVKTHNARRFLVVVCAALMALCPHAFAKRPRARVQTGTVEMIDLNARVLVLRPHDETVRLTLVWDARTRFVEDSRAVTAADLSKGTPVALWYRRPLFGGRYATRIWFQRGLARSAVRGCAP